jgi:hypothetical protein
MVFLFIIIPTASDNSTLGHVRPLTLNIVCLSKEKNKFASLSTNVAACRLIAARSIVVVTSRVYTGVAILCVSNGHGEEQGDSCPHEVVGEFHAAIHVDHARNVYKYTCS